MLWGVFILGGSVMPSTSLPLALERLTVSDKLLHAGVYFVFTLLMMRGLAKAGLFRWKTVVVVFLISALYGVTMEILQYKFFPGRYFETLDIFANIIGSIIALFVFKYFNSKTLSV